MKLHPRLTPRGVLLARDAERFRPVAEGDGEGGWVVGFGHRASAREGARVTGDDALALLTYDLSQSAGRIEPLLTCPVSSELFDALNARAFRMDPEAFSRSDLLRRVNAGEDVFPGEADGVGDPRDAPPLAVAAASDAVRDRLAQVLAEPEPPPPRPPREPWREPAATPAPRASTPDPRFPGPGPVVGEADRSDPQTPAVASGPRRPDLFQAPPLLPTGTPSAATTALGSGPALEPLALCARDDLDGEDPPPSSVIEPVPQVEPQPDSAAPASRAPYIALPAGRGGRPRPWERLRGDPRVYMAVGACGLALFVCALLGFLLGRPTAPGLALGIAGIVCLAPALAFFLHGRAAAAEV